MYTVLFETETKTARLFDQALLVAILVSVLAVCIESIEGVRIVMGPELAILEWTLTGLFTVEYLLRTLSMKKPLRYVFSFFGMIDLLSILPTFLTFFFVDMHSLSAIRALRLLRMFRVLKLGKFLRDGHVMVEALKASRFKIAVFLAGMGAVVLILGALMYVIEGPEHGFTSIPKGMYWAVVTMTTVGYGDVTPQTALGQSVSAMVMLFGYGIIAVPTGIVTAEMTRSTTSDSNGRKCLECQRIETDQSASYCRHCGEHLENNKD